eukprot:Em0233g1a
MFRPQIAEHPILGMKILDSAGIYTGDEDASDQDLLVVERLNITEVAHDYQATKSCMYDNSGWSIPTTLGMCRDTYWVESFNHQLLTYLPKRIHFHTKTFEMRMNLAVMDWNENCQRMATSHHEYTDVRRPDNQSTYNVLVKKTYRFVNNIWSMYVLRNITSQQILQDEDDDDDMVLPDDAAMYDGDYVDSEDDDYVCSEDGGDDEEEDN